jgi:hypothetical protein
MWQTTLLLIFCLTALGQAQPAFEASVVKPAGPPTNWNGRTGIEGGPGTDEPGRITYSHLTLRTLLWMAYTPSDFGAGLAGQRTIRYSRQGSTGCLEGTGCRDASKAACQSIPTSPAP